MDHSDSDGCACKTVRSLENTCHTWAFLGWWFTKRRYIKCTYLLPLRTYELLPVIIIIIIIQGRYL